VTELRYRQQTAHFELAVAEEALHKSPVDNGDLPVLRAETGGVTGHGRVGLFVVM